MQTLEGHSGRILPVALSPDCTPLASTFRIYKSTAASERMYQSLIVDLNTLDSISSLVLGPLIYMRGCHATRSNNVSPKIFEQQ